MTATSSLQREAEEDGFAGLDFDAFGVFPMVTLKGQMFGVNDGTSLGQAFNAIILKSRPKWLYTNRKEMSDPEGKVCYSYDQMNDTKGRPVQDVLAEWRAAGWTHDVRTYLEVAATLEDGRMVLLSVSPQSVGRFSKYYATMRAQGKRLPEIWTLVYVGPEVSKGVKVPFNPWEFKEAGT